MMKGINGIITNAKIKELLMKCAKDMFKEKFKQNEWTFGSTEWADGDRIVKFFHTEWDGKLRHYFYYKISNKYIWYELIKYCHPIKVKSKRCIQITK